MTKIAVIGGGPAGVIAAYAASQNPNVHIDIYERNEKLFKKLFITGKGRCNVTNSGDASDFFNAVTKNEKFLYSAFYTFDNYTLINLIEQQGTKLVSERGNRVFPESSKSSDIIKALLKMIDKPNIKVFLNMKIDDVIKKDNKYQINDRLYDKVIVAGGGMSYPVTGSDGNTYEIAKKFGHEVTRISSGLCGINTFNTDTHILSGLSLKNVTLTVSLNEKIIYSELGEMEFTHYGISGPIVLSASSYINDDRIKEYEAFVDLKPGLTYEKLDARILRDIAEEPNKSIKNVLGKLMPLRLMELIFLRCGIDDNKKCNQLTKEERTTLCDVLKNFTVSFASLRPLDEAIITRGGIELSEINPSTMESKICEGLYFAGEILDLDAMTGGFNLQIAFSTGYLAGMSAAE